MDSKITHHTFLDLFNEITYAYESQYGIHRYTHKDDEYVTFHKLTLCSAGIGSYKTSTYHFPKHLWWKVIKLVELLEETEAEKVLYGNKTD